MDWLSQIRNMKNEEPKNAILSYDFEKQSLVVPDEIYDTPLSNKPDVIQSQVALIDHLRQLAYRLCVQMERLYGEDFGTLVRKMTNPETTYAEIQKYDAELTEMIKKNCEHETNAEAQLDQMRVDAEIAEFEKGNFE